MAWERTLGDILSDAGYATAIVGKWHIGASKGRWPTDHGFDEWIGIPRSYDEALWPSDPWYDPKRDPVTYVLESTKGKEPKKVKQLTVDVKLNLDVEYMRRSKDFIDRSVAAKKPFFLYFNHTLMHFPTAPREEFRGRTGHGPWADSLAQLDGDFGELLDYLEEKGIADNTIVIFSGDNGSEYMEPWRGDPGIWEGSYFTGMEGSLRTPGFIRYPGVVPAGRRSNEIVHITDMFTTLVLWAGAKVPDDRIIDGVDQRPFFEGRVARSARDGFPYWNSDRMYGVKWRNFKVVTVLQKNGAEPFMELAVPHVINLDVDPKERKPYDYPYVHSWVIAHSARIIANFKNSLKREELIPPGAHLDFVPGPAKPTQ